MKMIIILYFLLFLIYQINAIDGVLPYTNVITFGDSTTDSGTAYRLSNHTWPPVPPFNSNGGFADGLLWNQILAQKHLSNAMLEDYSCGSATTDNLLAQGSMSRNPNLITNYAIRANTKSPGVRQQIAQYINSKNNKTIDFDRVIYIIWSGTNNYYFNKTLTTSDTVQSIIDCLNLLIKFGARNLAIINEPPFDRFPAFRNKIETNMTKQLYIDHNTVLATKFNENYSPAQSKLNIRLLDSYAFVSKIMENYTNYGFENLDSCWDTITNSTVQITCQNITKRMFCDEYHLTSQMQTFVAQEFYRILAIGVNSNPTTTTKNILSNVTSKFSINLSLFIVILISIFFSQNKL